MLIGDCLLSPVLMGVWLSPDGAVAVSEDAADVKSFRSFSESPVLGIASGEELAFAGVVGAAVWEALGWILLRAMATPMPAAIRRRKVGIRFYIDHSVLKTRPVSDKPP